MKRKKDRGATRKFVEGSNIQRCSRCRSYKPIPDDRLHGDCGNSKAQKWADYVHGAYTGKHVTRWNDICHSFRFKRKMGVRS